ncbi:MAG: hypothetical protein HQK51_03655 [Oligoflexia bacterium]|nr:hypothetical protein [Oligoflexia bacterium]
MEYGQLSVQLDLTKIGSTLSASANNDISTYQYPNRFSGYYWGPIIGYYDREQPVNPIFKYIFPWVGIYSRTTFDYDPERAKDRGKGMGYGINLMPLKNLHFFVQYRTFDITTKGFNDYSYPLDGNNLKTSEYLAGVLIPLWVR